MTQDSSIQRLRRSTGLAQHQVASRCGISRAAVSAIESGRIVPSVATALRLAALFSRPVEELFGEPNSRSREEWAWAPREGDSRYWSARIEGRALRIPVEETHVGIVPHHGIAVRDDARTSEFMHSHQVLVVAGCDPAMALVKSAVEANRRCELIPLSRSSREALDLLKRGLVHVAGVHVGPGMANAETVRKKLGSGFALIRVAEWEEGIAVDRTLGCRGVSDAFSDRFAWVVRETGSVARSCFDELCQDHGLSTEPARPVARSHRAVATALSQGWAQAGICIRVVAAEANLDFFSVRRESYDLCYRLSDEEDPRIVTLIDALRTQAFRRRLGELPGYDSRETGNRIEVA